ncbi:MAG: hypothetical protein M3O89_06550 [Actinomycetota bacterium]|nr:hypothetical protein [Actinomycetota bacterium]
MLIAVPPKQFVGDSNYETRAPGTGVVRGSPDCSTVYVQTVAGDRLFVSVPFRNAVSGT